MIESILGSNFILACDSYKVCHIEEYPEDTDFLVSSIVPRKAPDFSDEIVAAGQTVLAEYLASVKITDEMIDEAEVEITEQGYDFPRKKWEEIRDLGHLPLQMWGVEEGRPVKPQTPIVSFINTKKGFGFLVSYIETIAQRTVWKMSTVATISRTCYKTFEEFMLATGSDMSMLEYKLHNFGDRGADAYEAAICAAIPHAMLFSGSDCLSVNRYIKKLYGTTKAYTSSVEATEHSVMCSWSDAANKDDFGAAEMVVNRLEAVVERTKRGIGIPVMSAVIDTYDDERFVKEYLGTRLKDRIINSGGKLVARPDSGNPLVKPVEVIRWLEEKFGATENAKNYFVLHPAVGAIQGDGINVKTVRPILQNIKDAGYSMDNIVLGMGGGLTHEGSRDLCSFSMKATARYSSIHGWVNLLKEPKTDAGKKSLTGVVSCIESDTTKKRSELKVIDQPEMYFMDGPGWRNWLTDGKRGWKQSFDNVREWARS